MWPNVVYELVLRGIAEAKLGRRGISAREALQLLWNHHRLIANPRGRRSRTRRPRLLMIGTTDGGRYLTLVVEPTQEVGTWLVITGWDSDRDERSLLRHG